MKTPAIDIALTGQYIIEASAGTGKTWTLTGIILRLLIEEGRACDNILATTFTRSATADIQERIRKRLQEMYKLLQLSLQILEKIPDKGKYKTKEVADEQFQYFLDELNKNAELLNYTAELQDAVNFHLIQWIAKQTFYQNIEQEPKKIVDFRLALYRTKLAISQLNRLFIGTLDSLCQKLLREYNTEIGYQEEVKITNQYQSTIHQMIHDQLRAYRNDIFQREPKIYQLMQANNILAKAEDFLPSVEMALTFYHAKIDDIPVINPVKLEEIEQLIFQIIQRDDKDFEQYLEKKNRQGMNKTVDNYLDNWQMLENLLQQGVNALLQLSEKNDNKKDKRYAILENMAKAVEGGKLFNKGYEEIAEKFSVNPTVKNLAKLFKAKKDLENYLNYINQKFHYFICNYVRNNLAKHLELYNQTTFSLQLAKLNEVLLSNQGQALAQRIRHDYPIALIDESQDINTEQAILLQHLYLKKEPTHKEFLLLVGDPKQAIYGFRGGDVKNYNLLKKKFKNNVLQLKENYRSSAKLVHQLNQFFDVAEATTKITNDKTAAYFLGEEIFYQHIQATRLQSDLSFTKKTTIADPEEPAIFLLNICDNQENEQIDYTDAIVTEILTLLSDEYLYKNQSIKLNDIGILAYNNEELKKIEIKLQKHGINTLRSNNQNIFTETMAKDLISLMELMLNPFKIKYQKKFLLSHFFQLTLQQINELIETQTQYGLDINNIQKIIQQSSKLWQTKGFLPAVQWLLTQQSHPGKTFWQQLASHINGERLLVDLRQILDIISERGQGLGEYQLLAWIKTQQNQESKEKESWILQQPLPSEKGVQLMTIHKSKGLEFPIVFIVGLTTHKTNNYRNKKYQLYKYTDDSNSSSLLNRRLSVVQGTKENKAYYKNLSEQELEEEKLRQNYVALTRARDRLYIIKDTKKGELTYNTKYVLEKEVKKSLEVLSKDIQKNSLSNFIQKKPKNLKKQKTTSFSQIIKQNISSLPNTKITKNYSLNSTIKELQFQFEKGANAGTFLHKILEELMKVDMFLIEEDVVGINEWLPSNIWSSIIDKAVKEYQLSHEYLSQQDIHVAVQKKDLMEKQVKHIELAKWLFKIVKTPLKASQQSLFQIPVNKKLSELSFNMSVKRNFSLEKLNKLFDKVGISLNLQEDSFTEKSYYRYLRGEIDLVYQYEDKFYVVDYKSNFLGEDYIDYNEESLKTSMNEHHYWLQASLYQVALHQYLSLRLPNYDIHKNLGSVEYLFLRGIESKNTESGKLTWSPPSSLIFDLSELFSATR